MKKYLSGFFVLFLCSAINAVAQTANVTIGCVPLEVKFKAPFSAKGYYWDFKDGPTSVLEQPTTFFTNPGVYDVELREGVGGKLVGTIKITALAKPQLNFTLSQNIGCAPLAIQFKNTSVVNPAIKVLEYTWLFGDGVSSKLENPSHTFNSDANSTIQFDITTDLPNCNQSFQVENAFQFIEPPVASFTTSPESPFSCDSVLKVKFTNTSTGAANKPLKYSWNFGNGNSSTLQTPAEQTFKKGTSSPSLQVEYVGITGCSSNTSTFISVGGVKADMKINADTFCFGQKIEFSTTSFGSLHWIIGTGNTAANFYQSSGEYTFVNGGLIPIKLIVTSSNGQCSDSISKVVFVEKNEVSLEIEDKFDCHSPAEFKLTATSLLKDVKYYWSSGGEEPTISNTRIVSVETIDKHYYGKNELILKLFGVSAESNITGCVTFAPLTGTFAQSPNALYFPSKTSGCVPHKVVLRDSSTSYFTDTIKKWEWNMGNGDIIVKTTNEPVEYTYTTEGDYKPTLTVTTKGGCKDTSYAHLIEVGTQIPTEIDFAANKTEVCPGEEVTFTVTKTSSKVDAYHFYTESNRGFSNPDSKSMIWKYNYEVGPQDVSLQVDYNGCMTTVTKNDLVLVKGAVAKIDYLSTCKAPTVYNFKNLTQGTATYNWNFGDKSSASNTSTNTDDSHTYASSGNYSVILTATPNDGCNPTYDTVIVKIRQLKSAIAPKPNICINDTVRFDASSSVDVKSTCGNHYTWLFSDPERRPMSYANSSAYFGFNKSGRDSLRLVVEDDNGCKDTSSISFKVFDMNVSAVLDKNRICVPNAVEFKNTSTGDTTLVNFRWIFGDGDSLDVADISHLYTKNSTLGSQYPSALKVTDILGCKEKTVFPIENYTPFSSISVSKRQFCLGDTITVSASDYTVSGSSLDFSWDYGNSETGTLQSKKVYYPEAKTYNIKLDFTEKSTGCKSSTTSSIDIQSYPIAKFSTDPDSCAPKIITFKDASISVTPVSVTWINGAITSNSPEYAVKLLKGSHPITQIVKTTYGCADTATTVKKLYEPSGNFDMSRSTICKGSNITFSIKDTSELYSYTWAYGDGYTDENIGQVTHQYNFHPPTGTTIARLILYSVGNSCAKAVQKPVNIQKVIAEFDRLSTYKEKTEKDSSICQSEGAFNFINKSIGYTSYKWNFGDGQTSSTDMTPSHVYAPGKYNVQMSVADTRTSCVDTITKTIFVYKNPEIESVGDTVCLGKDIQLSIKNPVVSSKYLWQPSTGLSNDTIVNPIATLTESQVYRAIVKDTNTCYDTTLVYNGLVTPLDFDNRADTIVIGDIYKIPVTYNGLYNFNWTPSTGLSCQNCTLPEVRPLVDTEYKLLITDVLGCFNNDATFKVVVRPETFIKLPTSFTPNHDNNNDVIYVEGWGIKELLEFQIFNRWGESIYKSNNLNEGWDGKFKGEVQNADAYVYKVKALTWRDEEIIKEGYINLIR